MPSLFTCPRIVVPGPGPAIGGPTDLQPSRNRLVCSMKMTGGDPASRRRRSHADDASLPPRHDQEGESPERPDRAAPEGRPVLRMQRQAAVEDRRAYDRAPGPGRTGADRG